MEEDQAAGKKQQTSGSNKQVITKTTTTTTTVVTKQLTERQLNEKLQMPSGEPEIALVEELGRRPGNLSATEGVYCRYNAEPAEGSLLEDSSYYPAVGAEPKVDGHQLVTSISTIVAQSGQSRIVLALLKDASSKQLKIQEMRPGIYEVGGSLKECSIYLNEHRRILKKLAERNEKRETPIEAWLIKYYALQPERMRAQRKLVYLCMLENLRACWSSLLKQLELRNRLLEETRKFYELAEQLAKALEQAEQHTELRRRELLAGSRSGRDFELALEELAAQNGRAKQLHSQARRQQRRACELVGAVCAENLGDARPGWLAEDALALTKYLAGYLRPLELRQVQVERVLQLASTQQLDQEENEITRKDKRQVFTSSAGTGIRAHYYSDLTLVESWLSSKVSQLNSSLLASLGLGVPDSRSILSKHEQIALECRAIEDATSARSQQAEGAQVTDSELRSSLAARARLVLSIVDARISLLRRAIDFYLRAREASADLDRMMRRLEADNSLQSVQFVASELELRDVSSVVASGGTIISELQQLQLAQQQGERSRLVSLNLQTSGLRSAIDQLSQQLAHLKTNLNQRKLLLANEDSDKLSSNFASKSRQLHLWLGTQLESFLRANERIPLEEAQVRAYCEAHEQLRVQLQARTPELEALVRCVNQVREGAVASLGALDPKLEHSIGKLRGEWVDASNRLERRFQLASKYLELLSFVNRFRSELEAFESLGRAGSSETRSELELRESIEQAQEQLEKQLSAFQDHQHLKRHSDSTATCRELLDHTSGLLSKLVHQKNTLFSPQTQVASAQLTEPIKAAAPVKRSDKIGQLEMSSSVPSFKRPLPVDEKLVEPFSVVELECEVEPVDCKLEWLMNNFKMIPHTIKHSISSDAQGRHRLIIHNFSPHCCATYLARASNQAGQSAISQCRLKLRGISETPSVEQLHKSTSFTSQPSGAPELLNNNNGEVNVSNNGRFKNTTRTSSSSYWRTVDESNKHPAGNEGGMERLIRGVDMNGKQQQQQINTITSDTETEQDRETSSLGSFNNNKINNNRQLVDARSISKGTMNEHHLQVPFVSPAPSSPLTETTSPNPRSLSNTPVCLQDPRGSCTRSCSRTGSLVCLVLGSPVPNIEWLHNNRLVASAKCTEALEASRFASPARSSLCKLTIETAGPPGGHQQVEHRAPANNKPFRAGPPPAQLAALAD